MRLLQNRNSNITFVVSYMKYLMVSSGAITIALIPSESRETKLEMTRMDGVKFRELGSLSNDDGDGNEYGKKAKGLDWQNNHAFL